MGILSPSLSLHTMRTPPRAGPLELPCPTVLYAPLSTTSSHWCLQASPSPCLCPSGPMSKPQSLRVPPFLCQTLLHDCLQFPGLRNTHQCPHILMSVRPVDPLPASYSPRPAKPPGGVSGERVEPPWTPGLPFNRSSL